MAVPKKKKQHEDFEPTRRNGRGPEVDDEGDSLLAATKEDEVADDQDDEDADDAEFAAAPREEAKPDPREIDRLTDRIFGAVLSRYGWEAHDGRIEHMGAERRPRARR